MNHLDEANLKTLQFYSTAEYDCSYLPDRQARSQVAAPTHLIGPAAYSRLIEQGFRRSGLFTYRPQCATCQACLPIRVDVHRFQPKRSQRRVWRHHQALQTKTRPLAWDPEHYALYRLYQQRRHPGAGMDEDSRSQYTQFLLASRVDSHLVEFRLPDGKLQMIALIDTLDTGLSAVYTFFDPDAPGSLGTYGVLWQIARCQALGLPWLYLGYWITESRKMAYKSQFQPFQILRNGVWGEPLLPK
ncbi:arginyltransferase [Alcaligenaceae bacterium]|nr:arginyltransferase [Alcaligenaceae bacterium]